MDDILQGAAAALAVDAAEPAVPAAPSKLEAAIEAWFVEHFHGSQIAANTEHYNLVRRAVDGLKRRLQQGD